MYNLIVGSIDGVIGADRMLESTDPTVREYLKPGGALDASRILQLPTLVLPEIIDESTPQVARLGNIISLVRSNREFRYRFIPHPHLPDLHTSQIEALAGPLHITDWELRRTHWAVKDVDLYGTVLEVALAGLPSPSVFELPSAALQSDRIAVMMPFASEFDGVWGALSDVATTEGWRCQRVKDIWDNHEIIQDVIDLIATSKVVICDLTGRNANVFYEAGITHTLGREFILITQSAADVPFDLQHLRYVHYLNNQEGLAKLKESLVGRLRVLMAR